MPSDSPETNPTAPRPLAEPPIFNYERFYEEDNICSDTRLRRLFANDYALGFKWRDIRTEWKLNKMYLNWCIDSMKSERGERKSFYWKMGENIWQDAKEGDGSRILEDALRGGVITELGLWECRVLDEDEGTKGIEKLLGMGKDVFSKWSSAIDFGVALGGCRAAFRKHGHLAKPEIYARIEKQFREQESVNQELEGMEARFLDEDGGTTRIQRLLENGEDIFNNWSTASGEVMNGCQVGAQKYGHLASPELWARIYIEFERRKRH